MNNEIRRRALLATAKVALSFTVLGSGVGCGTVLVVEEAPDEPPIVTEPEEEEEETAVLDMPTTSAPEELVCGVPSPLPTVPQTEEMQLCCEEHVTPHLPQDGLGWDEWLAVAEADPGVPACCSVLLTASDAQLGSEQGLDWQQLQACCSVTNSSGPTCAPWGPPVPPMLLHGLHHLDQLLMAVPLAEVA